MNNLADIIRRGIKDHGYGYTLKGTRLTVSSDDVFAIDLEKLADFIRAEDSPVSSSGPSDKAVKAAAYEYLSHKGERPDRVLRGGQELWETHAAAIKAAIIAATAKDSPVSSVEPAAWQWRHPRSTGGEWHDCPNGPRPHADRLSEAEYRPLYAHPPSPAPREGESNG